MITSSGRTARLLAGALPALPALALAADPEAATHGVGEATHASPSLFSVDPGLMIWTIVTFLVVLTVLRFTAWGPLLKSLEEREKKISGAIAEAQRIKSEAEELLARYRTMMDEARNEARGILEEARKDGVVVQEEIRERAQQEAQEFRDRARREIELAKDGALKEIWAAAANLSTELATRILGRTLTGPDQERLVHELVEEMRVETDGREIAGAGQGAEKV